MFWQYISRTKHQFVVGPYIVQAGLQYVFVQKGATSQNIFFIRTIFI